MVSPVLLQFQFASGIFVHFSRRAYSAQLAITARNFETFRVKVAAAATTERPFMGNGMTTSAAVKSFKMPIRHECEQGEGKRRGC